MNQRRITLVSLLFVVACAPSKQLNISLEKVERDQVALKMQHAETQRKLEDLSNFMMVLEDRLETLKVAADRKPVPMVQPGPKVTLPTTGKAKSKAPTQSGRSIFGFGQGGGEQLPSLQLTNRDLDEMDPEVPEKRDTKEADDKITPESRDNPEAARAYNEAFKKFEAENYPEAIRMLETFVGNYPTHVYSDNAVFWIGESYYRTRDFVKGAEQFERVVREFPTGNKVPDALLRSASCYLRLNQISKAKHAFEKIIATYPQSVAAQKARASLTEISDTGSGQRRM